MELSWSSPHTPLEIIPQSQLFSGSAPAAPTNLQVAAISGTQTESHLDHQFHRRGRVRGRSHAGQFGHVFARGLPASRFQPVPGHGPDRRATPTRMRSGPQFCGRLGLVQPGGRHHARSARCRFRRDGHDGDHQFDLDDVDAIMTTTARSFVFSASCRKWGQSNIRHVAARRPRRPHHDLYRHGPRRPGPDPRHRCTPTTYKSEIWPVFRPIRRSRCKR